MRKRDRCECLHCKDLFMPNGRNWWHQKFCNKPECRKASKVQSHRRWLSKPENQNHFRGSANVERVRQWRAIHPGYWKRPAKPQVALQDLVTAQVPQVEEVEKTTSCNALQDLIAAQDPLVLGLITHLIDSPLQDNVEQTALRLLQKGHNFLDIRSGMKSKGNTHANKEKSAVHGAAPESSGTV